MKTPLTGREALALLKREFQLSPTMPAGGISVLPSVAFGLCDELDRALVVVEAAQQAEQIHLGGWSPHVTGCKFCYAFSRTRDALAAFDRTEKEEFSDR